MTGGGRGKVYTVLSSDKDAKVIIYKKSQFSIIHLVYAIFCHHKNDCLCHRSGYLQSLGKYIPWTCKDGICFAFVTFLFRKVVEAERSIANRFKALKK